ncbi:MAG: energy transducer TonB [Acidobacteriota bacterium]|nr:energy transducer TonB [Acidobacteriota bacterium]
MPAAAQVRIVVARGAVEGGAYVNRSIGIAYRFPPGWLAVAEPGGEAGPLRVLLRAVPPPRNNGPAGNSNDRRRLTLYAVAQQDLPADQRTDPARFLATDPAAKWLTKHEAKHESHGVARLRTPLHQPQPLEVYSRSFVRADYRLAAAQGEPGLYDVEIAGVVNGHMLLLSALGATETEAVELAETAEDLTFSPPPDPDDSPTAPSVVEQRPDALKRIRQSESAAVARVRTKVEPEYPVEARERGVEGDVLLAIVVGAGGNVVETSVISGHPLLNDAALEAVKQWKFQPLMVDGAAVETETKIRVRFKLSSAKQSS